MIIALGILVGKLNPLISKLFNSYKEYLRVSVNLSFVTKFGPV